MVPLYYRFLQEVTVELSGFELQTCVSSSENIAHLAESALRFLELVQENNVNTEQDLSGEDMEETLHPNENYDSGT